MSSMFSSNNSTLDNLVICSLNVRGLSNAKKRRETFNWLRNKKYSVYLLQEVHCSKEMEHFWLTEWGYKGIFSSLSSARAGVCILFNNNFAFDIQKYYSNPEGRYIIVDIKTEDQIITLLNLYAPNNDEPTIVVHLLTLHFKVLLVSIVLKTAINDFVERNNN